MILTFLIKLSVSIVAPKASTISIALPYFENEGIIKFDEIIDYLEEAIKLYNNGDKLYIVAHDWGAFFSFNLMIKNQAMFEKIILLDVADLDNSYAYMHYFCLDFLTNGNVEKFASAVGFGSDKGIISKYDSNFKEKLFLYKRKSFYCSFIQPRKKLNYNLSSVNKLWFIGADKEKGYTFITKDLENKLEKEGRSIRIPNANHWDILESKEFFEALNNIIP